MPAASAWSRSRLAALAALSFAALAAGGISAPTVRDVTVPLEGGTLRIGGIRPAGSIWGAALAQSAGSVAIENVALDFEAVSFRFRRAEFVGTGLSQADLAALLDKSSPEGWAARLTRLKAERITIPELVVEQRQGDRRAVTTYQDVIASEVAEGRIAKLESTGASVSVTGPGGGSGAYGRIALDAFDLAEAVRLYTERAGSEPTPLKQIYGAVLIENLSYRDAKGAEVAVARITGRDFRARATPESWSEMSSSFGSGSDWNGASAADRSRLLSRLAEVADAFAVGSAEMAGLEIRDAGGKAEASRIARMSYDAAGNGPAEARAEGLEIASASGTARIREIALTGLSLASSIEGLRAIARKPPAEFGPADLRRLAPTIGTVRLSGLAFEPPPRPSLGEPTTPIRFGIGSAEIRADNPVDGVPTNVRLAVDQFSFEIPPETEDAGLKELRAMGYERPDLSWLVAASWNEPGDELLVRELSLSGVGMGAATVRGVLGNVSRDVFNGDSAVAAVALVGATLKNIDLTIENGGLFERLLAQEAERQSKRPDDLRLEYGMAAAVGVPAMLGGSGPARAIGQAVARFVAKPGRLSINARTKDPAGLGIADLASVAEPSALLDQLEVTARAE